MNAIAIFDTSIRQDSEGRFSLNDLHHAAGGAEKHRPSRWIESKQTKELAHEISKAGIPALVSVKGGKSPGTYACRELVIAYAAWISPTFHLKVLRVFLAAQTQAVVHAIQYRPQPAYMAEPWFAILRQASAGMSGRALARALCIHPSTLSQVLNGTGKYGSGRCSTGGIAQRVQRAFCGLRTKPGQRRQFIAAMPQQLGLI